MPPWGAQTPPAPAPSWGAQTPPAPMPPWGAQMPPAPAPSWGAHTPPAPAPAAPAYNYNWHIKFGMDNRTVKTGNCRTFGCLKEFDFDHLGDACQCYPGCDKSPVGNICCSDFQQSCNARPDTGGKSGNGKYIRFENAYCSNNHGGDEISKPQWVRGVGKCRNKCNRDERCEGFTIFGFNHFCILLSRVDITHCNWKPGAHAEMKNPAAGGSSGSTQQSGGWSGPPGPPGWPAGNPTMGPLSTPGWQAPQPSYKPPGPPGPPGMPGWPSTGTAGYWPWMR
uniref:SMB domain-containing protein n=1 Tax=Alexandrium monilatum TaxID=311494 RepID=A0A7S4UWM3_9DINO